jgi:hypothetical protein
MKGYPTTFLSLFDPPVDERPAIAEIEIPIIQRDFAQGRNDDDTRAIRERFVDALIHAVTTGEAISLDFIYGDVAVDDGLFQPLDGQQRLTTLFLLHWYVASRADLLEASAPWLRFSYATRPTARDFTAALRQHPYPSDGVVPSAWLADQPWFVYPWRQDPTISSMLVMLDAIHERFDENTNFSDVWARLEQRPTGDDLGVIWFLFLPVPDMQRGEDLYIKMNSRGKPLTAFEVFKADFESIIKDVDPDRYHHLAERIDGKWADILWAYEKTSGDYVIDDEFMRYINFIVEVAEWRDGNPDRKWHDKAARRPRSLEERAHDAFADPGNPNATRNRDFFFHAFDTWIDHDGRALDPALELGKLFRASEVGEGPLPLFSSTPDLFGACITKYGSEFSAQETLLLFAVLLSRQAGDHLAPEDVARRLRSVRNITAAFLDRDRYMSDYIASTEKLMLGGVIDDLAGFRDYWVTDEGLKWTVMDEHPEVAEAIHEIEDSSLVRGRIQAFDLDTGALTTRAAAFAAVRDSSLRDLLGAALLTKGDYSRDVKWSGTVRQLGSSAKDDSWMDLLTTGKREELAFIREPLTALLDDVARRMSFGAQAHGALTEIHREWLVAQESQQRFDWRYYLTRYPGARSAVGDGYFHNQDYDASLGGFSYRHLRVLVGGDYTSHYRDALLRAAWIEGGLASSVDEPDWYWNQKETWIDPNDPGMRLKNSRAEIRCLETGFQIVLPLERTDIRTTMASVLAGFPTDADGIVQVAQNPTSGRPVDSEDRIQVCIRLVKELVSAGL